MICFRVCIKYAHRTPSRSRIRWFHLQPKYSGGLINTCASLKVQQNEKSATLCSVCELATKVENTNCLFDNGSYNGNTHIVHSDANNLTILQLYNFHTKRYWDSRGDDMSHVAVWREWERVFLNSMKIPHQRILRQERF